MHARRVSVLCSIVGALSKKGNDVTNLIIDMIKITRHRGPDGVGICIRGEITHAESPEKLDLNRIKGNIGIGHARLDIYNGDEKRQPIKGRKDLSIVLDGEIYNYRNLANNLINHKIRTFADAETVLHVFEDLLKKSDLIRAMRKTMSYLDGIYAFAMTNGNKLIVSRDPVGIKPLYLAENEDLIAFASERKALWKIGILNNIRPLAPGNFAVISDQGLHIFRGIALEKSQPASIARFAC